jgi:putative endonuclease
MLVWFEQHSTMEHAIVREKRVKKWNRAWKLRLIEESNPRWRDLAEDFGFDPLPK